MADISETSLQPVNAVTFREYLKELFPSIEHASEACKKIQISMISCAGIRLEKLNAFACTLFPPVRILVDNIADIKQGDILPQFAATAISKKYYFDCQICPLICGQSGRSKRFEGVSQMYQHGLSTCHANAFDTASGKLQNTSNHDRNGSNAIMMRFLGKTAKTNQCDGVWDPAVVKHFENDQAINRMSIRKLFYFQRSKTECKDHESCYIFEDWIQRHPENYAQLKDTVVPQAMFFAEERVLKQDGKEIHVTGCIKSTVPPCNGYGKVSSRTSDSTFVQNMCEHCYTQFKYLKNLSRKRSRAALESGKRLRKSGMRYSYLTKPELKEKQIQEKRTAAEQALTHRPMKRTSAEWLSELKNCCTTSNQKKFIVDCLDLFKHADAASFEIQMNVLTNIIGTLRNGRNHHYTDIVKKIARMSKNWLGTGNYSKIQVRKK